MWCGGATPPFKKGSAPRAPRETRAPPKPSKKAASAAVAAETAAITSAIESENADHSSYQLPPVSFLRAGKKDQTDATEEIRFNRDRLNTALSSFGVNATIRDVTRGPTVTRYDLEPEAGVKLNKITNLSGDLALALGVENVRIAPIPDKISTVGIEVPNKVVSAVCLRDIIDSPAFRNAKSKLSFAVGKDIGGNCIIGNIAKLPHMLIAGTTGSGKSVCINSLIVSLLYKSGPDDVRFLMIDPKVVELGIYNGIPHLYVPVVTEAKEAASALSWGVAEMERRLKMFSKCGVRNIITFNEKARAAQAADELLSIKGVEASFALFVDGEDVNISARSLGAVNVQVVMEKLGGGGHQTMAGAQLKDTTVTAVRERLIEILNETQIHKENL